MNIIKAILIGVVVMVLSPLILAIGFIVAILICFYILGKETKEALNLLFGRSEYES